MVTGYGTMGFSHLLRGDFHSAIECLESGSRLAVDPLYSQVSRTILGMSYLFTNQLDKAETAIEEVLIYCEKFGARVIGAMASICMGVLLIAKGQMSQGLKLLEEVQRECLENQRRSLYVLSEHTLAKVYSQIVEGSEPISLSIMAKNIGFLIKSVPFASKKAEEHFNRAIEVAKEIGVKRYDGNGLSRFGFALQKKKGRPGKPRNASPRQSRFLKKLRLKGS